jgi:hypothetical protein
MEPPTGRWTVRKALLLDIPPVARLIEPPPPADRPDLPDEALFTAARLLLTHVGLEAGEFWVAADDELTVRAAVVLLPPREDEDGQLSREDGTAQSALRLHLGLSMPMRPDLPDGAQIADRHWLLLCVTTPGSQPVMARLLERALPAVNDTGLPVLCPQPGDLSGLLHDAGFRSQGPQFDLLVRPAVATAGAVPQTV